MLRFLEDEIPDVNYREAKVVILPVPFERTTSFGQGTARGPQAVLEVSPYLETYDEELKVEPFTAGIFTRPPLLFDEEEIENNLASIKEAAKTIIADQKFLVSIGGEHTISFPLIDACLERFKKLSIVQLDAHADLRDRYQNTPYSHACVMRRVLERTSEVHQLGIRAICKEEAQLIEQKGLHTVFAHQMYEGWPEDFLDQLQSDVYLTIDTDFFDPAFLPGTGTPEPGGFFWPETMRFLKKLFQEKNVVAVDVVELSPMENSSISEFNVARLIYKLIAYKLFLK